MIKRKLWTNFDIGQRFKQESGRLDDARVQMGFEELSNIILEDGLMRKRPGCLASGASTNVRPIQSEKGMADPAKIYKVNGTTVVPENLPLAIVSADFDFPFSFYNEQDVLTHKETGTGVARTYSFTKPGYVENELLQKYEVGGVEILQNGRRIFALGNNIITSRTNSYVKPTPGTINDFTIEDDGIEIYDTTPPDYDIPEWSNSVLVQYSTGDVVIYGGQTYSCKLANGYPTSAGIKTPVNNPAYWVEIEPYGQRPLTADYAISVKVPEVGSISWITGGGSIFIGTDKGVFELASSYPYGLSPEVGGLVPRLVHFAKTYKPSEIEQVWSSGRISIAFLSNPDEVTLFNKYSRQAKSIRVPLSQEERIHSIAYFGGMKYAILICANASNYSASNPANYNPRNGNKILILDESNLSFTQLNIPAGYIRANDGKGIYIKYRDVDSNWKVTYLSYLGDAKYNSGTPSYQEDLGAGANIPVTSRIVTMPIHVGSAMGSDLNSPKVIKKVVIRVYETKSLTVWVRTMDEDGGTTNHPGQTWTSDHYVNTDVEFFALECVQAPVIQLVIENNSNESFNVLAIQADIEVGEQ